MDVREHLTGYLFILPAVLIIGMFGFFPIGYAVYMSLFKWNVRKGAFLGLANYTKAVGDWQGAFFFVAGMVLLYAAYRLWSGAWRSPRLSVTLARLLAAFGLIAAGVLLPMGWGQMLAAGDKSFLESLPITLYYALATVPAELILALILAYILFQKIRGQEFFRMLYFLPYITPVVASAVVFRQIFSLRETSLANRFLDWLGLPAQKWLFEPRSIGALLANVRELGTLLEGPSLALISIALFGVWTYVGYNTVIFLAGLGSIPGELYEAAEIDGASHLDLFRHITLPLLSPVTFYLALIAFIGTFKSFNHIYVMRVSAAQGTVDVTSVTIFDTFYKANQFGSAAAQAILLFLIILGLTYVQNKVMGEKVFYG